MNLKDYINKGLESMNQENQPVFDQTMIEKQQKALLDIDFIRRLLPSSYNVQCNEPNKIHCVSLIGINDEYGDRCWVQIREKIKEHFKERFLEINHSTCANHVNFTIYLRDLKQQHMDTKYGPSGRVAPSQDIDYGAEQSRQQESGKGIRETISSGMAGVYQTDTPRIATDYIKPFLMIDINAVKNKHYTVDEVVKIFETSGISVIERSPTCDMNFGDVLKALKEGKKLARTGWNGKGMFIYYVPANVYQSVTAIAREEFGINTRYNEYMAIKNVDGTVSTWVPSIKDCFANDWMIV